ncbi:MAG: vitamin K epoxide reductase family protein [Nanoarchaeota archaeon]
MEKKTALKIIAVFSFFAVLISLFLLYQHFSTEVSRFCNFGKSFSCDIVNKGEYSTLDGVTNLALSIVFQKNFYMSFSIPNALISIGVFFFFLLAAGRIYRKKSFLGMNEKTLIKVMKIIMVLSLVYAAFLIYIEAEVLQTWCLFCLTLDVVMLVITYALFTMEGKR